MSADQHDMVMVKGIRYRREDAKRLGLTLDPVPVAPDVAELEAAVAAQAQAETERLAAEQAETERLAAEQAAAEKVAGEKARTPANKGRTAPTKGQ